MEIKLSDGRIAKFKEAKGKDLFEAMRLASEPGEITKLLIARIVTIDDNPITEFDLEELPLVDVTMLLNAFSELYPLSQTQIQSSSLSKKGSLIGS